MKRPTLAEIATAAGVSKATVDRVVNHRAGVQEHTRSHVLRVVAQLSGRVARAVDAARVDVVLPQGDNVWIGELAGHLEAEAAARPEVMLRLHFEPLAGEAVAARLAALVGRTEGVALVGLDAPEVREAVRRLAQRGAPVVTVASNLGNCGQVSYVGIDNRAAGRLAGDLIGRLLPPVAAKVALVPGALAYRGHEEREAGFRDVIGERFAWLRIVQEPEVRESARRAEKGFAHALRVHPDLAAVYCIGGGIAGIARALRGRSRRVVVIAHELTEETRPLLVEGVVDVVIDQNARVEAREIFDRILAARRGRGAVSGRLMRIQTFFRENIPSDS